MRIVTFVKYVPDAAGEPGFESDDTVDRSVDGLLSELDEYAVEEALTIAEAADDAEVIALTVGPDDAVDAVRKALQMGADSGVHVLDDALEASDALGTSRALAAAVKKIEEEEGPVDLVITGMSSTDGAMSVVPVQVAELLDLPAATLAAKVEVADGVAKIRRDDDTSSAFIEVTLPALVSVTDQINEPRYPSFKGIMAAKKKPLEEYDLSELGLDASQVGSAGAVTEVLEVAARPAKSAGEIVTDEGSAGTTLVDWLAAKKLV